MVNLWLIYRLTRSIMVNVCFFYDFRDFRSIAAPLWFGDLFASSWNPACASRSAEPQLGRWTLEKLPSLPSQLGNLWITKDFVASDGCNLQQPLEEMSEKKSAGVSCMLLSMGEKLPAETCWLNQFPTHQHQQIWSLSPRLLRATVCRIFWKIRMQHRPQHGAWKWDLKMGHLGEILIRIQDPRIFHYDDMNWNPPVLPNIVNLRSGKHEINLFPFLQAFLLKLDMLQIPSWAQLIWINHGWVFVVPENYGGFPHSIHWLYHHVPICSYTFPSFSISFYLFPIENWHVGKPPLRPRLAKQEDLNSLDAWPNTWGWGWWVGEIDCFLGKRLKELPATWIMFVPYLEMSWG